MRFPIRRLAGMLVLCAALPLQAGVRGQLREPRPGAVLRGGTAATIEWIADDELPRGTEEWEAFLSADGGRYYAYRITPHLTLDERRFTFIVPNVEAEHARILIRAGNERDEIEIEFPNELRIEHDPLLALTAPRTRIDEEARGEAARPGDRGVIEWVDGDRRGGHLELRSALRHENVLRESQILSATPGAAEAATHVPAASAPQFVAALFAASRGGPPRHVAHLRGGRDLLRQNRRLNI